MDIYILNRLEKIVGVLTNEGEYNFLSSAILTNELNKMKTLELEISTLSSIVEEAKEENFVLLRDISEKWHEFIIKEVVEVHGEEAYKTVYCEDSSQELIDTIIEHEMMGRQVKAQELLIEALAGTRWEVGHVDDVPVSQGFPTETKYSTALEVVHAIREHWNLQIDFRVVVMGNKIVGRYVDLKRNIGSNLGKRFEYTKDLLQVERTIQSTDLKTAIIPIGGVPEKVEEAQPVLKDIFQSREADEEENQEPPIDITGVEWTTPANPVNKPLGQNYLEIPEATEQWGYLGKDGQKKARFIYYENTEITNPNELIGEAYKVLLDISKPITNYKLSVVDLFALTGDYDLSFESVSVGDIVTVIDHEFNPPIKIRTSIIKQQYDLLCPENSAIELGSFIRNLVDSSSSDAVQDMIKDNLGNLESSIKDVSNEFNAFQKDYNSAELTFNWIKNSDLKNNFKYWLTSEGVHLGVPDNIPVFEQVANVPSSAYIEQSFKDEMVEKLLNNNVTFSAFIKGTGKLAVTITFIDELSQPHTVVYESKEINSAEWGRFAFATALNIDFEGAVKQKFISFKFISSSDDSKIVGFMLNFGTRAGKYAPYQGDKYGKGVYDQVKDIQNSEFKNGLGYVYLEEEDGLWVYDKPADQRPMKMTALKGGMLGIGSWNLQTQQWEITTFIDGNMVNASCINTGVLNADLIKTGTITSLDGSVQINMNTGKFTMGGKGNVTEITNDHVRVAHNDGSYSEISGEGLLYFNGISKNQYHHLLYAGEYTCLSEDNVKITLPSEFRGKKFKVISAIKRIECHYDGR